MRAMRTVLAMLGACAICAMAGATEPVYTAPQLHADLEQFRVALQSMPADLEHSANVPALETAFDALDARLSQSRPLTRDEAWREFATINPLLADGHMFVGFVDWRADVRKHVESGGTLFPFDVDVTPACDMSIHKERRSSFWFPEAYARILAIDGLPAHEVCERLMARLHGDTRAFRADLLTRRFWFFYWKTFGAPAIYELTLGTTDDSIAPAGARSYPGRKSLPQLLDSERSFERMFELTFAGGADAAHTDTAVLAMRTFAWADKDQVLAFTKQAFESLQRWRIENLIIDLTDNGGGDDDQWIEGVMPYIATRRWRTASSYRKRVIVTDASKHETAGDVVEGEMQTWYEPHPGNPLRFRGKVYVAVGPGTYSSAVVMATVIQDFGFGKVIGIGGSVRANTSGGTRRTTLTNTGLIVVTPRFVLRRPSRAALPALLTPDIPLGPGRSLEDLPALIRK